MGGTQSLHTNSRDEALALPTEASARLALRTQQVIAYESGLASHPDPFGGSYVIEEMTDRIEAEANRLIAEVDQLGGMVAAIERGFPQREIQDAAYAAQRNVDAKKAIVVGVNEFVEESQPTGDLLRVSRSVEDAQLQRLAKFKSSRDQGVVRGSVAAIEDAAAGSANLMPVILSAVENRVSLGEIADALRGVFGVYRENVVV
jgi:methylmalonyl-CoA mutase N-terminal domain/subunit